MRDVDCGRSAPLRAANAGDGRAYACVPNEVATFRRGIVRAHGHALPPHHHENIVQEVLLNVHRKRRTWDAGGPLRPWLFAIARHKVADAVRAGGARVHLEIAEVLAEGPDPYAARDAHRLFGRLEPRAAEIVRSVHLDEEAPAEIGRRPSMSEDAVRVALHRALWRRGAMNQGRLR